MLSVTHRRVTSGSEVKAPATGGSTDIDAIITTITVTATDLDALTKLKKVITIPPLVHSYSIANLQIAIFKILTMPKY